MLFKYYIILIMFKLPTALCGLEHYLVKSPCGGSKVNLYLYKKNGISVVIENNVSPTIR